MIPTFVIGLREGIEASLIVGIVAAFLARADRRDALRWMWIGVVAAIAICLGVGIALDRISTSLPQKQQEGFETIIGLVAVGTVTAMIVWMKRHSRGIKADLETHAADALANGTGIALVGMAFFAVLREGFETSVFLLAAFQASKTPLASGIGVILGVATAVVLGYLIYRGAVRINLSRFFLVTGLALVLVAAGLVASAIHSAFEAGWITIGQTQALDLRWLVAPGTVRASLLTGMLGLQPEPTRAEVIGWLAYAVPMSLYLLIPAFRSPTPRPARSTVLENAA
jgi:high-affinity iron transporter